MKVYIDVLFLINIFFDFLLLLAVSLILRRNTPLKRIILGSIVGGISILFLFFSITSFTLFIIKIIIAFLMCITTFKFKNIKYTLINFSYLYLTSIVLGGFLYLINIEFSYKNKGIIFYHKGVGINIIIILIVSPILIYLYIKQIKDLKNTYSKYYKVNIYFKSNDNVILTGFLDTGNNLIDPYKNRPIILVKSDLIEKYKTNEKVLLVPFNTINNNDLLKCIRINKVVVNDIIYKNILIGLMDELYIDGVEVLLNNKMEGLC